MSTPDDFVPTDPKPSRRDVLRAAAMAPLPLWASRDALRWLPGGDDRCVGRWTADWLLARCLGRPAAVAAGDLGVQKAIGQHYLALGRKATEGEARVVASGWGEAANWATHLLLEELAAG